MTGDEATRVTIETLGGAETHVVAPGEELEIVESAPVRIRVEAGESRFWQDQDVDPADLRALVEDGVENQEIADRFDVNPSTVSRWLHRAGIVAAEDSST
jgi:hypothetical protein